MIIWINSQEAIDALQISKQAFHKAREGGKYRFRATRNNGGITYEIALQDLSSDAQTRYWQNKNGETPVAQSSGFDASIESEIYASAPEHARKKADKYLTIINQSTGLSGEQLKQFIAQWNAENPDDTTSYPRIVDARKQYTQNGVAALLGQHGKRSGCSSVPDDLFSFFKSLYLKEGRPSIMSCWKMTLAHASETGFDVSNFPSHMAFQRRVEKEIPEQALYTARNGSAAANKKYGYYIKRNYDDVLAGECWVSDHAQVDIAVSYIDANGRQKYGFPWVTAWRDFKSGKWMGWDLHMEGPNSDHIFQSFYRAAVQNGIPSEMYLDNGKDYRCRDFAGGRKMIKAAIDTKQTTSMTAALGIKVTYAWPYNAQSKTIERDFLRNKEWFSKHDSGYRGGNVVERPESLNDIIKSGKIMTYEQFESQFNMFITDVICESKLSSGYREGQTPNELWESEIIKSVDTGRVKHISKQALMLFCMRTSKPVSIGRIGIPDSELGVFYYDHWLEGLKGKKVFLRRDPKQFQEAWVFDAATNNYLGQVYLNKETPALAHKTEIGKAELQRQIAIKRTSNRIHKTFATADLDSMSTEQKLHLLAGANKILNADKNVSRANNCFPQITTTDMDSVMVQRKEIEKQSQQDFSIFTNHKVQKEEKKRELFMFPSDKEAAIN